LLFEGIVKRSCNRPLLGGLLGTATLLCSAGSAVAADPPVAADKADKNESERARTLAEMKEILASFSEAVKKPESVVASRWTPPATGTTALVAEPAKKGGKAADADQEIREIAGLTLSSDDDDGRPGVISTDQVEILEGAGEAGEAASTHALAMRLGHLDDVRWRIAAMARRPDPPRPPSQAEAIRRVIRDNFGLFDVCYEQGLRLDPALHGRVVVKFAIGPDGGTEFAADAGSDLADSSVVDCVVRAFSNLSFAPPGGRAVIVYPLVFQPRDATGSAPQLWPGLSLEPGSAQLAPRLRAEGQAP
jgi:hypothetical protein